MAAIFRRLGGASGWTDMANIEYRELEYGVFDKSERKKGVNQRRKPVGRVLRQRLEKHWGTSRKTRGKTRRFPMGIEKAYQKRRVRSGD